MKAGDKVILSGFSEGCTIPDGEHVVSRVYPDGSFNVGGNTSIWPVRLSSETVPNSVALPRFPKRERI